MSTGQLRLAGSQLKTATGEESPGIGEVKTASEDPEELVLPENTVPKDLESGLEQVA